MFKIKLAAVGFIICSFLFSSLTFTVNAQEISVYQEPAINKTYEKAILSSRFIIDTLMASQHVPGMQIAVSVKGKTIWTESFGYADLEHRTPVWPSTKMRVGSLSKTFTSVALGKLAEEGKLDLDLPVQHYVSYFPEKEYPLTTRQVAGHIAGIRDYRGNEFYSSKRYESVKEALDIFKDDELVFKPGEKYMYTSFGWNLVSAVIEGAAGVSFLDYMQENVLDPLELTATIPDKIDPVISQRTSYYEKNKQGEIINAPYVDNSNKWAGGGFLSTAEDLLKFGNAMLYDDYLKEGTIKMLWQSQQTSDGKDTHYGLGWFDGSSPQGIYWVGHSGGSVGGTTQFIIYPEYEIVVAITSNLTGLKYHNIQLIIGDIFAQTP